MGRVIGLATLMALAVLIAAIHPALAQQPAILAPVWSDTTLKYVYIPNEKYAVATREDVAGSAITYSKDMDLFATLADVVVLELKSGATVDQMTVDNKIVLFRIDDNGKIHVVAEVSVTTDPRTGNVFAIPTGIVHMSRVAPYAVGLYDFNGNLLKSWTLEQLIYIANTTTGLPNSSIAFVDGMTVSPSGRYVVVNGQFVQTGYGSPELFIFDYKLNLIAYVPASETLNTDQDVKIYVDDKYVITASNGVSGTFMGTGNNITVVDLRTGDVVWRGQGTPVVENSPPVYSSGYVTPDGEYVFLYKQVDSATNWARLEVWKLDGGFLSLVETVEVNHTYTTDLVQPIAGVGVHTIGNYVWIPFPSGIVIYNISTKQYSFVEFMQDKVYNGRLAAVSPQASYVILGDAAYVAAKQDIQSGEPRIRFEGDLIYNPTQSYPWELSTSFILEAPKDKPYHVYFESGQLKISYLSAEERPVEFITDSDIVNGKLGNMLDRSLLRYDVIYTDGATVKDHNLTKMDERTVVYERTHVLQTWTYARFFGVSASTADSGVIIEVPLNSKLTPYSSLTLDPKFAVSVVIPQFNPVGELMGVSGQIIGSGASLYTAKSLGSGWLRNYLYRLGYDDLAIHDAVSMWARGATKWGSRALFIVGAALAVDAGAEFYTHYENLKEYENIKTTVYTIPILVDSKTGEKYAVVEYFLPMEASEHENDFKNHVISYLERLGIPSSNIKIRVSYITDTWDNYMDIIEAGKIPKTNLLELSKMITEVPTERLKIDKIVIVIDTITSGYASTFDLLGGGYHEALATIVYGNSIQVSGIISGFETKDPEEIASLIPKVEINGQEFKVVPSVDGAVVNFLLPVGVDKLVVRFPNEEYYRAIFQLVATTLVKTPMVKKDGYYEANFHYDWKYGENNLVIVTKRMEFVDMPYPMQYAEREIKLLYGRVEPLEITKYFELSQVVNDPNSPSGERYYYGTQNPEFLDPSNGARMQTCKQYIFRYWYTTPPKPYVPQQNETLPINETQPLPANNTSSIGNAWIGLYLNGTNRASVIPRQLVVWLGATGTEANTVEVNVTMRAGYLDSEDRPVYTMNETKTFTVTIPANNTYTQFYDIQKFVAEAIEHAPRGFFEAVGVIVNATYNEVQADDSDRVTYFPPSTLPQSGTPVVLNVRVVDAINLTAIQNADVYLDGNPFGTTDANGWVNGSTITGLHSIRVEKSGYQTYEGNLNVFDNMTYVVALIPEGVGGYNKLEVLVQYKDGAPYEGASVTVKDNATSTILFTQDTDSLGLARFMIESGKVVDVEVVAGSYTFNFTGITMDKDRRVVATVPENSGYFKPEVAISNVNLKIHWGMGWYYGETPHLVETWVFSNVPQTVTLHYRAFNVDTNETLNETELTTDVKMGMNYVMNWVYLGVRNESENVAVEVTITSYEQDTNLENNRMVSNSVTIKPFIDLSVTVLWKPVKQKTPLAILPEDVIEVDIGFMIPCKLSGIEIRADVNSHNLFTKKLNPLERHHDVVASFRPNTTIWYNTTVVVPFTDKIVVNASIYHPWEYMGWNNYINTTIDVFPDTEVSNVSVGALLVQSGQDVDIAVKLRSNAIGRGTTISVFDEDVGDVIGTAHVEITEPEMEVKLTATAPVIGQAVETKQFNFNGVYETHTWNVSSATVDYWTENDYQKIQVTIWNIPWWLWLLVILIVVLFVLAVVHSLLGTVRERTRPRYRFFKKLEGEEEISDRFGLTTEEKGYRKFRFFRRLK